MAWFNLESQHDSLAILRIGCTSMRTDAAQYLQTWTSFHVPNLSHALLQAYAVLLLSAFLLKENWDRCFQLWALAHCLLLVQSRLLWSTCIWHQEVSTTFEPSHPMHFCFLHCDSCQGVLQKNSCQSSFTSHSEGYILWALLVIQQTCLQVINNWFAQSTTSLDACRH